MMGRPGEIAYKPDMGDMSSQLWTVHASVGPKMDLLPNRFLVEVWGHLIKG